MTAMLDRPFPFSPGPTTMPGMQRDADLSLRERNGIVRVRVNWPTPDCPKPAPVLVFLSGDDTLAEAVDARCRELSADHCLVVLSVRTAGLDTATTALEWAADHATQLEADPGAVLVGGIGEGADLAARVAASARANGWPELIGEVLLEER
jgi:alpha/beta hydrolase fold